MLRAALLASTLLACLLLGIAEFLDLNEIRVITVTLPERSLAVGGHHGYALLIIALASAVMAYGASRGSRPAALALVPLGIAALLVVLLVDLPDTDATGLVGRDYEQAQASAAAGFKLEAAGAILLFASAMFTAFLPRPPAPRRPPTPPPPRSSEAT